MINVTKSYLPNREKYKRYVDKIFDSCHLTNNGPLKRELEQRLSEFLGVNHLLLVCNGTAALSLAFNALKLSGSVITTPFTFAATTGALTWGALKPKFVDVCQASFNLDPAEVAKAIDDDVSAILPVHVFGGACDVLALERLAADKHKKLIYDASHCFGVRNGSGSLLQYGDASTLSFHATKLFHTVEGGAVVFKDQEVFEQAKAMINFGIDESGQLSGFGTNAKMSEFHAAMGLCVLDDMPWIIERRAELMAMYHRELSQHLSFQQTNPKFSKNHAYCPVLFESSKTRDRVDLALRRNGINPRVYFSPSLDTVYPGASAMSNSRALVERILCLPLYAELTNQQHQLICKTIKAALRN